MPNRSRRRFRDARSRWVAVPLVALLFATTACGDRPAGPSVAATGRIRPAAALAPLGHVPDVVDTRGGEATTSGQSNSGAVAAGAAAPAGTTALTAGPVTPGAVDPSMFGVNIDGLWNYHWTWTPADRDKHLRTIAATGVRSVRASVVWQEVQSCRPSLFCSGGYNWARHDEWIGALAAAGLNADLILGWSARWASSWFGEELAPPLSTAEFAGYTRAVVSRYGRNGAFWRANPSVPYRPAVTYEVWNEPNMAHWWKPTPNPGAYAGLYLTARDAVKAFDPAATVIVGGIASSTGWAPGEYADTAFLRRMYEQRPDLRGRVDGVGFHPYAETAGDAVKLVAAMRATLRQVGEPAVPLYITEIGWPTKGRATNVVASEDIAATMTREVLEQLTHSGCGVAKIAHYTWVAPEQDPNESFHWMGLYNRDATPKATGRAFTETMNALVAGTSTTTVAPVC